MEKTPAVGLDRLCRGSSQAVDVHVDPVPSDTPCSLGVLSSRKGNTPGNNLYFSFSNVPPKGTFFFQPAW